MAKSPLFSTYKQGENRVTSSMLAVFERIDLSLLETLLAKACGEFSLQMVTFTNQPKEHGNAIPDARISAHFSYWFEVKTIRNAPDLRHKVEGYSEILREGAEGERLFLVTPDAVQPAAVDESSDRRVAWFSFAGLSDAIEDSLDNPTAHVSEQTRFLLRELQALFAAEGLLDNDDVVVVAARSAWPEYVDHAVYVCQPEPQRTFRPGLTHMGFYADKAIQPRLPEILHHKGAVPFTREEAARRREEGGEHNRRIADVIDDSPNVSPRVHGETYQVFLLSGKDDAKTIDLNAPIINDKVTENGRPYGWTLSQRYTSLERLRDPAVTKTSHLDAADTPH